MPKLAGYKILITKKNRKMRKILLSVVFTTLIAITANAQWTTVLTV